MNLEDIVLQNISLTQNDKRCMIPLTWSTKVLKFTKIRSRMVLGAGRGVGELVFNGCRGSVWKKEKVPEMNNGDGYTTMWVCLTPLDAVLKGSENGQLYTGSILPPPPQQKQWSKARGNFTKAVEMASHFYIRYLLHNHSKFSCKEHEMLNGPFYEWNMSSLRDLLEICPSLESMVRTNYGYRLSSHSISNTQSDSSPGPGIRRWGLSMNHGSSEGPFRAARQHQLCPTESAHL